MSGPFFRCGGGGIPAGLQSGMDAVLNKKFGTSTTYPASGWPDNVNLLGPLPIIISNKAPIVSFNDGADDVPISEGTFYIAPSQSGTGTPSPSNPRPIVGYTGMTINQTGKNLLKLTDGTYSLGNTQATITISNGTLSVTGTTTNSGGRTTRLSDYFLLKKGTYYLSPVISSSPYVRSYLNKKSDNTVVGYSSGSSFTVTEDIEVYFGVNVESGYTYNATLTPQLEVGSTATTYEAYKAKTPIVDAFGRTIYGGELNVTTGVLTVTHGYIASYNGESINEPWISSIDAYVPNTSPSTGAQVAYTLATPQTYQLTPHELRTFYGANNFYCDTGDSQLNYRADISLYINNH